MKERRISLRIVDAGTGIAAAHYEDIKKVCPEASEQTVCFFYKDRDWIVVNEDMDNAEVYKEIIALYMSLSEEHRHQAAQNAPETLSELLKLLDAVIFYRQQAEGETGKVLARCSST